LSYRARDEPLVRQGRWIAGPSYLVAMVLLFVFRLGPEERMMAERFGPDWEAYRARTSRLLPGIY
jgi:protein-S-isoprenylcysteine O-methyltransferase Ste14